MLKKLRVFWENWKKFGRKVADFQGRVLLTLFYYTILLPIGLVMRFITDPFKLKTQDVTWEDWAIKSDTLEEASSQA